MIKPAVLMLIRRNRARRSAQLDLTFTASDTLDPRTTFTRASSGTDFDSTGRLVVDGNDVARFDYDPATPAGTVGAELVANGDFSNGTTGWNVGIYGSTLSVSGGALRVTRTGSIGLAAASVTGLVLGKTYAVTVQSIASSGGGNFDVRLGTSPEQQQYFRDTTSSTPKTYETTFKAISTTLEISLFFTGAGIGSWAEWDNISVREVTFTPRGLLIEEARTNLLLHSRDMTQAAWSKTDVTAARTQVGIDGVANSACLMTEGVAGISSVSQAATVTAGSTITVSKVLKRGNIDWVAFWCVDTTYAAGATAWFNLATGAKGSVQTIGVSTNNSSTIANLGGGWYRCTVTSTPNGSYTVGRLAIQSATADGSTTRVPNATYILDCAQLEVGSFATSIIHTGAATATRAADNASMTGTNFSSWFNATQGTFVLSHSAATSAGVANTPVLIADGPSTNLVRIRTDGTTSTGDAFSSGVNVFSAGFNTTVAVNSVTTASIAYGGAGYSASTNAQTVQTGTGAMPSGINVLNIGFHVYNANRYSGWIRSIRYYSVRLGNSTLQALTA